MSLDYRKFTVTVLVEKTYTVEAYDEIHAEQQVGYLLKKADKRDAKQIRVISQDAQYPVDTGYYPITDEMRDWWD